MADGIGLQGGKHPCYHLYKDYVLCVHLSGPYQYTAKCWREWEDFDECVHRRKMDAKLDLIRKEKQRLIKEGVKFEYEKQQNK